MHTTQFYNCQLKTNNYDKKYLQLQNIQSCSFHRVFARVYLGSRLFLFRDTRCRPFGPDRTHSVFSGMASYEHAHAMPDSTIMLLHLLCRPDFNFPDAVPFHVTEMEQPSSPHLGKSNFELACTPWIFLAQTSRQQHILSTF